MIACDYSLSCQQFFLIPALTVEFQLGELNVSEAMGTVEVIAIANGTSEFDYTVNLTISDNTTGGITVLNVLSVNLKC